MAAAAGAAGRRPVRGREAGRDVRQPDRGALGSLAGKHHATPKTKYQMLENQGVFLDMLRSKGIRLVNIGNEDLVEGNRTLILGLTWTLILRYEIQKYGADENELLRWVRACTKEYKEVKITSWGDSFNDGLAFCALIHKHAPEELDYPGLDKGAKLTNLKKAFDVAEAIWSVPQLLDPADLAGEQPTDDRSVITYVARLRQAFSDKELEMRRASPPRRKNGSTPNASPPPSAPTRGARRSRRRRRSWRSGRRRRRASLRRTRRRARRARRRRPSAARRTRPAHCSRRSATASAAKRSLRRRRRRRASPTSMRSSRRRSRSTRRRRRHSRPSSAPSCPPSLPSRRRRRPRRCRSSGAGWRAPRASTRAALLARLAALDAEKRAKETDALLGPLEAAAKELLGWTAAKTDGFVKGALPENLGGRKEATAAKKAALKAFHDGEKRRSS